MMEAEEVEVSKIEHVVYCAVSEHAFVTVIPLLYVTR